MAHHYLLISLVVYCVASISVHDERRQTIERVRNYLQRSSVSSRQVSTISDELENSNKIGLGFNLISGTPVCYTSKCQMAGFTRSIFKLKYNSPATGACTKKLIPDNVELDCLPTILIRNDSEIIDTVEQLHKSISNKVETSIGAKYKGIGFSYKYSRESQYMLDTIVKNQQVSILTKIEISYVKLSMFELTMELSDNFRYVIENMPCCEEDDPDTEEYVNDFIFDYFGFTYVTSILLGGVAQQHITISREAKERLETQGVNVNLEASVSFPTPKGSVETGTSITNSQNSSNYQKFAKEIQGIDTNTLGGDIHLTSFTEWSKTVPNNPVITQFALRDIFRLFNQRYFPDDLLIKNKSKLIEKVLEKYLAGSIFCYDQCGGNGTRGTCEPSGYFQFGICKCKPGWTGPDCGTPEPPKILHGTICGFDRSFMRVNCHGERPWIKCPRGWTSYNWATDLTVCYKVGTEVGDPVHGTLCGLHSSQTTKYAFNHNLGCGTATNMLNGNCPAGYQPFWNKVFTSVPSQFRSNAICAVTNAKEHLPGTLCGMQVQHTVDGPSCNDYNPGLEQCPPDYALHYTAFNDLGFMVCVKK